MYFMLLHNNFKDSYKVMSFLLSVIGTFIECFLCIPVLHQLITTVGYLLEVFIKLWIPSMVRIFTSTWS